MDRKQKIEEALSIVWEEKERKINSRDILRNRIRENAGGDILDDLAEEGYVRINGNFVEFTDSGETKAKDIIRRQRLAERLLLDVLEIDRREMDSSACEFEHILSKEVEESICTLLGHPAKCPHGLPIPSGDCCRKAKDYLESIVVPLSRLKPGETAKIVYLLTAKHPQLHKLMSFGMVPGATISVHETSPSVVIKVEETHVALEKEIAQEVYVKKTRSL